MNLTRRDLLAGATACFLASHGLLPRDKLADIVRKAEQSGWRQLPIGELVVKVGLEFLEVPYVGGTLEISDTEETCVINFEGLDCVTFYELSLCLARMIKRGRTTLADLQREVVFVRYRDGKLQGYLSRLHYTTDWIHDNAKKGVVEDLTAKLPHADRMDKAFDFMSTHPKSYRQLAANPGYVARLAAIENSIAKRRPWFVPRSQVADCEALLRSGDIIGIATSLDGLDCSHTGVIAITDDRVRHFLNASSIAKKVVLGPRLSEYLEGNKRSVGIVVARPR